MISKSDPQEDGQKLMRWMRGHVPAVECVGDLFFIFHLLDDLIDKDAQRTDEEICRAFFLALVGLHRNEFFARNAPVLMETIERAYVDWRTANTWERRLPPDRHLLSMAYVLRCSVLNVITKCAELCGGIDWAIEVDPEIRAYGQTVSR